MAGQQASIRERIEGLREAYAQQLPAKVRRVESLWSSFCAGAGDGETLKSLRQAVHALAGSGATFGYPRVSEVAQALEEHVQNMADDPCAVTDERRSRVGELVAALGRAANATDDAVPAEVPDWRAAGEAELSERDHRVVYLVDADAEQAEHLAAQIMQFGYQVEIFATLDALADAAARHAPSAAVIDMSLVGEGDADRGALSCLEPDDGDGVPIVFVSTRSDIDSRLRAVRAGADGYFAKPIDIGELVGRLDLVTGRAMPDPYRILIIEDDPTLGAYYASVLQQVGMTTEVINDPLETLERIDEFAPDLVLTDFSMPQCSGFDLAKVIRQKKAYAAIPIVFLSSETDSDQHLSALRLGGDDFLPKPVKTDELVASVTSRAQRSRILQSLMTRDGLTGLLNHSRIKEQLATEVSRARRDGATLSFAMLDLDRFKSVNDTYGHPTGDRVLKSLAEVLSQRLRRTDIIGRYGGEEFAVILINTDGAQAKRIFDEIRESFAKLAHYSADGEFTVTFSCGIAEFPAYGDPSSLSDAADKALYAAKRGGRNRTVLAAD